jgi:hypothetical protein
VSKRVLSWSNIRANLARIALAGTVVVLLVAMVSAAGIAIVYGPTPEERDRAAFERLVDHCLRGVEQGLHVATFYCTGQVYANAKRVFLERNTSLVAIGEQGFRNPRVIATFPPEAAIVGFVVIITKR